MGRRFCDVRVTDLAAGKSARLTHWLNLWLGGGGKEKLKTMQKKREIKTACIVPLAFWYRQFLFQERE